MINIATSPGLNTGFADLLILLSLSVRLSGNNDIFSISIKQAIRDNKPAKLIIQTVKDAIEDNRYLVEPLLGIYLTNKIIQL